jgi:lipoprotein NlpD
VGCASESTYTPETYVVQPRDTLYSIAWRHDLDYRDLAKWNHIGADYRITVGQVLMLKPAKYRTPQAAARGSSAPAKGPRIGAPASGAVVAGAPTAGTSNTAPPSVVPPGVAAPGVAAQGAGMPPTTESFARGAAGLGQPCSSAPSVASRPSDISGPPNSPHWTWPTAHASAPRPVPGGGILLLGAFGQPIRAACAGRVVYAGSGIRGYGNLIIIKHGDTVLSAYAHTVELRVHEGQEVTAGEEIAHMGTGPHDIAALYFEIRLNGKPVDPLPFLPAGN